ncbi:MAG: PrsW family intramembrane metalloprotease [Propionibacteriaceae bacterium]|jgi:RsiW-degrading membrane proteinase PrsW (M82 family)|nr:PrsW family intramembrane metalloprotease [Propionibacteriaceae bacterium]
MPLTPQRYGRLVNNLPAEPDLTVPLPKRILKSPWLWVTIGAAIVYALLLLHVYGMYTADADPNDGVPALITFSTVKRAFFYALPTLGFWVGFFILLDRFRPAKPVLWFLSLGWGAAVAVFLSVYANTWASEHLSIAASGGDPAAAARPAVFIAPFTEEATKATVLFWLAILVRYRIVTPLNMICLAGLSAAGFAFTENITYYSRAIVYASSTIDVGDANAAIMQTVMLRGVYTSFGHPLFTCMTGFGLAIALRTRSKIVRVLAPLCGFGVAAFGHMLFNSQSSMQEMETLQWMYFLIVIPGLIALLMALLRMEFKQGRMIKAKLTDYVRMGWLLGSDPIMFSKLRLRLWALILAAFRGWHSFVATVRLQHAMTELAYLRDGETRGVLDASADERAKELIFKIRSLRDEGISDTTGLRLGLPSPIRMIKKRLAARKQLPPSTPSGWAAPTPGATNYGYSAVNPTWGPPQG